MPPQLSEAELRTIVAAVPAIAGMRRFEHLDAGYSGDAKYVFGDRPDSRVLLRVSAAEHAARRFADLRVLERLRERGIACPEPLGSGTTADGRWCYVLVTFIEGEDGERALPRLALSRQLEAGRAAGRELWRLHQLEPEPPRPDWPRHRLDKYVRRRNQAVAQGLRFEGEAVVRDFIEDNLGLIETAPVRLQHDDYHPGNLIFRDGTFAGVVDFNRCDYGDPIEDFQKVPWFTTPVSSAFARGQVEGYWDAGREAADFWPRYNLYVALNLDAALVWIAEEDPERLDDWRDRIARIVATHDFAGGGPPAWFREAGP